MIRFRFIPSGQREAAFGGGYYPVNEMETRETRHAQLTELGFTIDDNHPINIYNHHNGMWITDYALDQYSQKEWDAFILEFEIAQQTF